MKITSEDEYGLRILLRIGKCQDKYGMSVPQLSKAEGLSQPYVSKITRSLRISGLITSTRGHKGGYLLSKPAIEITVNDAIKALGGRLYDDNFCGNHTGQLQLCTNSVDCSIRSLWTMVQQTIDGLLDKVTLQELIGSEEDTAFILQKIMEENTKNS
ncbi:MAG: Rrf2 family iron-sulfur cluster assembly transcriptional regulator [Cyclobacteriaceae bacterium]|jgi:Rrf2 family iron-sulfur cluster assembly transcriptional regulator